MLFNHTNYIELINKRKIKLSGKNFLNNIKFVKNEKLSKQRQAPQIF